MTRRGFTIVERPAVSKRERAAFTIVELLVVIAIITVLMGLLLPSLRVANEQARSVKCLSNLRQMAIAATAYVVENRGSFPIAYYTVINGGWRVDYGWDFTIKRDLSTGTVSVVPGLLWQGSTNLQIQQCPSFDGRSNTLHDPYTGYNYNTSHIGHGQLETITAPARIAQVRQPSRTALFGDGQYASGANKFMRAPFPDESDWSTATRSAGTQGFRHRRATNVAFVDGHAEAQPERFTRTLAGVQPLIVPGTGFLSADNSLYDLN